MRLRGSFKEAGGKLAEGAAFLGRGLRLMGTDLSSAGSLFSRAALGDPHHMTVNGTAGPRWGGIL